MATLLAALALAGASHSQTVLPHGTQATWHSHHGTFASGIADDRSGWSYQLPVRHPARVVRRHVHHPARHVQRRRRGHTAARAPRGRVESWLVTYYTDVGPMADGVWTYWGAASCGYDVALGTRLSVPGVAGILTCHDRMCTTCFGVPFTRHVDIWGYRPGLGHDWRNVTVY